MSRSSPDRFVAAANRFAFDSPFDSRPAEGARSSTHGGFNEVLRELMGGSSDVYASPPPLVPRLGSQPAHEDRPPSLGSSTRGPPPSPGPMMGDTTPPNTPRKQLIAVGYSPNATPVRTSPQPSPASSFKTATPRTNFNSPVAASRLPPPRSPYSTPVIKRSDAIFSHRVLDSAGMTTRLDATPLAWCGEDVVAALHNTVYEWSATAGTRALMEVRYEPTAVAACVDGAQRRAAIAQSDGLVWVFEAADVPPQPLRDSLHPVTAMHLDTPYLYCGNTAGELLVYNVATQALVWRASSQQVPILRIAVHSDKTHIAVATASFIAVHTLHTQNPPLIARQANTSRSARAVAWCDIPVGFMLAFADGQRGSVLVVSSLGGTMRIERDLGCEILAIESIPGTMEMVVSHGEALDSTKQTTQFANIMAIYRWGNDGKIRTIAILDGHRCAALHLRVSTDGEMLVSAAAGDDNTLRFWRLRAEQHVNPSERRTSSLSCELR